jgi:hypothetical protein
VQFFGFGTLLGLGTLAVVGTAGLARGDRDALFARGRQMAAAVTGIISRRRP